MKILLRAAALLTLVISFLAAAPSAWGAVRYVDSIAGTDAGECVQASPCKSIDFALGRPGAGDEIIVASGTYELLVPLAITEEVDLHGVAGDPRPVIRAFFTGMDAMTVGGAAAGSRFSHLQFAGQGGAVSGSNAAVRVTTPATFEDVAFTLTAASGTPERRRAFLVDLPAGTTAPVVLRGATVTADAGYSFHDGAGLIETFHGTLQIRDLVLTNVAQGTIGFAGVSAGSETGAADAILDVDGATITTAGRCLGLFGGSASAGSTLRNLTVTQYVDGPTGTQATVECVRIGSHYTTIEGMKVTALETSTVGGLWDDAAIEAWQANNLTLRRIDVTSNQPALYAGAPGAGASGYVTNLQIHGARMQSMGNSAVLIRNGTGRITDVLAVSGAVSAGAGLHFRPAGTTFGNQFSLRNVTAIGNPGASTAGIYLEGTSFSENVAVTGRNVIATGSFSDLFITGGSSVTLDHSFVATTMGIGTYVDGGNNSPGPPGFVNAAGGDYHLTSVAAALNAGVVDSFVGTEDFEGDSRVGAGLPDAGADERRPAVVPQTTITGTPPVSGTDPTVTFHFIADDAAATFSCAVTGSAAAPCTSPFTSSALPDGLHTFTVTAANTTGPDPTPATFQFRVDSTAPNTAIGGSALTGPTPTFALTSAGEPTATFECALDGAAFAACPASYVAPTLAAGQHTLRARAFDAAGNRDATPAELTFTVDTTRPNTLFKKAPTGRVKALTARFVFSSTEAGSRFQCKLDKKAWASCKSPKTYKKLKKGKHTFQVRAIDPAGNIDATPAKRSWRIR